MTTVLASSDATQGKALDSRLSIPASGSALSSSAGSTSRRTMNGKVVIYIKRHRILNLKSKFEEKRLCDGYTFSAGDACVYKCAFCFTRSIFSREAVVQLVLRETGIAFEDLIIRRQDPAEKLRLQLLDSAGRPRYRREEDRGKVVYASPIVDIAANLEFAMETAQLCRLILEFTHWDIRLLTKSNLLPRIAEDLGDFCDAKKRIIYGVSTGTLDDKLAAAFEENTAKVSQRIKSLHVLQDAGHRTFGMVCPSLPQTDYDRFSLEIAAAIRADRCEHIWGEVINVRGESFTKTANALSIAGYWDEVKQLAKVSGAGNRAAWEDYARATFESHTKVIPAHKLRFLQYVKADNLSYWQSQTGRGAVLLGKIAHKAQ